MKTVQLTTFSDEARARVAAGLRAMADALEQGAIHVSGGAVFLPRDDHSVMLQSDLVLTMPQAVTSPPVTNPRYLPSDVRQKLIHSRDAFNAGDNTEAHHWLYAIACPSLTCLDPWAAVEGRTCACGPHPMTQTTTRAFYGAKG